MREILVVANRTHLRQEADGRRFARGNAAGTTFRLVVPQSKPSDGYVIYDEVVRDSAQVRVDLALSAVAAEGIDATGEVGDEDPFLATMDAVAERRPVGDHHLHPPGDALGLAAARPDRADPERLGPSRRARRRRPRARGQALRGDAGRRQQDLLRGRADRAPEGEGVARQAASLRGGRAAGRRRRPRPARGPRAARRDARPAQGRRPAELGDDRRPRPLHGDDQRARAVQGRRRRHLHAPGRALRLAARRT